jgi:hypothetical protein
MNPDLEGSNCEYNLDPWTSYIRNAGFPCSRNLNEISVFDRNGLNIQSENIDIQNGWNFISGPLTTEDMTGLSIFLTGVLPFFAYIAGCAPVPSLENGNGY